MDLYVKLRQEIRRLLKIRTRRHALTCVLSFLLCIYFLTLITRFRCTDYYSNLKDSVKYHLRFPDDVSCYHRNMEIDELKFIKKNAMYLISASCDSSLSVHHACVIESVMATHGYDVKVYVFFTRPVTQCACSEALIQGLKGLPSLTFITIQIDKFVENTPLKGIFGGNFLKIIGRKKHARVAEILKFATLYKFGGTVIDLDMIMAKPVRYLGLNWAVRINGSQFGSAAIALTKKTPIGKSLLTKSMQILIEQRDQMEIDGGLALTEAFRELCYNSPVEGCPNFKIYGSEVLYPYNKSASYMMFERGKLHALAFGYYVWDLTEIRRNRGSVYVQIMREHCPNLASYFNY